MAVAVDRHAKSRGFWFQIELCQIVQDINRNAANFENFYVCKFARPCGFIDIAAHCDYRRDLFKSLQNFLRAHVACVNDVIGTLQSLNRLRTQQPMRVGDHADNRGLSCIQREFCSMS